MKRGPRRLLCSLLGWVGGLAISLLGLARRMTGGLVGGMLFVASLLYLYSFRHYGINVMDEGVPLNGAQRIIEGEVLYRDFYGTYGPARYYLLAAVFGLFGSQLIWARLLWHLILAACGVMVYRIGRRLMPPAAALMAGAFFVFVPVQQYKVPFVATYLVVILATLRAAECGGKRAWLVAGLWGGVSCLFRLEMGIVSFCLSSAVLTLFSGRPGGAWFRSVAARLACLLGGIGAILAPVSIYFAVVGGMPMLVRFTRLQYDQHGRFFGLSMPSIPQGWEAMWHGGLNTEGAWKLFDTLANYMPGFLCAGALALVLVRTVQGRHCPANPALLAIGVAGIPMQKYYLARPDFDHLLHIVVTAYLLAFALAAHGIVTAWKARRDAAVFWRNGLLFALCMLFLAGFAFTAVFRRGGPYNVPVHAEEGGSVGKAVMGNREEVLLPRARYLDWLWRKEFALEVKRLVRWAQKHEEVPDDGFAFFKFGSFWYFALELKNPTNQELLYSYGSEEKKLDAENEEERVIRSLEQHRVRYVFLEPDQPGENTFRKVNWKIWNFLQKKFELVSPPESEWDVAEDTDSPYFRAQGGWTVWRRK